MIIIAKKTEVEISIAQRAGKEDSLITVEDKKIKIAIWRVYILLSVMIFSCGYDSGKKKVSFFG